MPTPSGGYLLNNKRIPSVTAILGRFKQSSHLIEWANRIGREGLSSKTEARRAADAGTAVHDAIEQDLRGLPTTAVFSAHELDKEQLSWATNAYQCYLDWKKEANPVVDDMELQLISSKYGFGGTPDAVGLHPDGQRILYDWKTSGKLYADYYLQAAAYAALYEENTGNRIDQAVIVRFDKSGKPAEEKTIPRDQLKKYFDIFKQMIDLYNALRAEKML